jgi:hypothetical protein
MCAAAIRVIGLALALGSLSGCTSTGPISGQLVLPGQAAQRVTLTYVTDRFDEGGQITGTKPSGESFSGRFVQVTPTSTVDSVGPMWSTWSSPIWNDWGPFDETRIGGSADAATFRTNYSGKVVATLSGDRGTVMRCRFELVNRRAWQNGGTGGASSHRRPDAQLSAQGQRAR